jgi:CBS domain-containing protein
MNTPGNVKTRMRWPVAAVGGATPLREVAESLVADELGALAVVENDRLIGVISERDVVRQVAMGADPDHTRAADMMSTEPVTVVPEDTLEHAATLMREAAVRHLPVVEGERIKGFLSIRDLLD